MFRELVEEIKRRRQDHITNNTKALVLKDSKFHEIKWANLKVGDIVLVHEGEHFPADLLLLQWSDNYGTAYIQTMTLDGENVLKPRQSFTEVLDWMKKQSVGLQDLKFHLRWENPNNKIYQFEGQLSFEKPKLEPKKTTLSQFLLRGATLSNTDWVIGMVIYAGHDTKIIKNMGKRKYKQTHIEKTLNIIWIILVAFQILLCLVVAILSANYTKNNSLSLNSNGTYQGATYLFKSPGDSSDYYLQGIYGFITFFLLLSTIIPISLLVSLEIIKVIQGLFIIADVQMYSIQNDQKWKVMTFSLNEELGLITDIFTDKTGTLTSNEMVFKAWTVARAKYDKKSIRYYEQSKESSHSGEEKLSSQENINDKGDLSLDNDENVLLYMNKIIKNNQNEFYQYNEYKFGSIWITTQIDFLYYFWLGICWCHEVISISKSKQKLKRDHYEDMLVSHKQDVEHSSSISLNKKNTNSKDKNSNNGDHQVVDDQIAQQNISENRNSEKDSNEHNLENDNFSISELDIDENEELVYHGMSPDEITLVNSAKKVGFEFRYRSNRKIEVKIMGQRKVFNLLRIFPFTSDRKRMTIVIQDPDDLEYAISFTKGADNVMKNLSLKEFNNHFNFHSIDKYAKKGYRTLLVGMKIIRYDEYLNWEEEYDQINKDIGLNQTGLKELEDLTYLIEQDLFLLGTTALEDKLQDNVHEWIEEFRRADIKVWMITGDKLETAENIGISCKLLQEDADRFFFTLTDDTQAVKLAKNVYKIMKQRIRENNKSAIDDLSDDSDELNSENIQNRQGMEEVKEDRALFNQSRDTAQITISTNQKFYRRSILDENGINSENMSSDKRLRMSEK